MDLLSLQNVLLALFIISIIHNFVIIMNNYEHSCFMYSDGIDVQTSSLST